MKKHIILLVAVLAVATTVNAQEFSGFDFTNDKSHFTTSPKDEGTTSCSWDYAGISMLESELYRTKKQVHDLSEMWIARHAYFEKAMRFVRMHGKIDYPAGGVVTDVFSIIEKYGIVPEEVYFGKRYDSPKHNHKELVAGLTAYLGSVVKNRNGLLTTAWVNGLNAILDAYMGPVPENFVYRGKEYTPKTFAKELGIKTDDYVIISSFECYPTNEWAPVEVPGNWAWNRAFNVDFEIYKGLIQNAVEMGYTVATSMDYSNANVRKRPRLILLHARDNSELRDEDKGQWSITSDVKRANVKFSKPTPQRKVTSERRTESFLNYFTTDDRAVHIYGTIEDQYGQIYYKVKDSAGDVNKPGIGGFSYLSPSYFQYMSTMLIVNKNSLPASIKKKL